MIIGKAYHRLAYFRKYLLQILERIKLKAKILGKPIYIGQNTKIFPKSKIEIVGKGIINIGKNCVIHDYAMVLTYGGSIEIGDNCSINPFSILYGHGGLKIGNCVRIAAHTIIIPANHIYSDIKIPIYLQGETTEGITIEDDVWIGAGCRILDGVRIGKGSVIGAGSVVTESIPEYSVAVGIPARIIQKRGEKK